MIDRYHIEFCFLLDRNPKLIGRHLTVSAQPDGIFRAWNRMVSALEAFSGAGSGGS
jgi:hypothetical protein